MKKNLTLLMAIMVTVWNSFPELTFEAEAIFRAHLLSGGASEMETLYQLQALIETNQ